MPHPPGPVIQPPGPMPMHITPQPHTTFALQPGVHVTPPNPGLIPMKVTPQPQPTFFMQPPQPHPTFPMQPNVGNVPPTPYMLYAAHAPAPTPIIDSLAYAMSHQQLAPNPQYNAFRAAQHAASQHPNAYQIPPRPPGLYAPGNPQPS